MKIRSPYLIEPGSKVRLNRISANETVEFHDEEAAAAQLAAHIRRIDQRQDLLYASASNAVLIVLQGMDTSGKDGTIRHIFSGVNPQGCTVTSFKVPTPLEVRHDFLWRCHAAVPPLGMIGIFNRSHYEDLLSPRVHGHMTAKTARLHMKEINQWEEMLHDSGVTILKFFLHISFEEQGRRLQARLDDPDKHWKISPSDFTERKFWAKYQGAYEDIFEYTSQKHAPWFVIPSDHKWYRNLAISKILAETLDGMKLKYPSPAIDVSALRV